MSSKKFFYLSSVAILPALYVFFYTISVVTDGMAADQWLPKWDRLLAIATIILLERIYTYRYAVSQKPVLTRDLISNVVNLYVSGFLAAMILVPVLRYFPEHFLGRKLVFASPEQLGPIWLQTIVVLTIASFSRYWIHRLQHEVQFLWAFHAPHHQVTDLKAINGFVSHPIDYVLRNVVIFLVLGIIGFHPLAVLLSVSATGLSVFSHCGADIKGGFLNYIFVTPEVHRWHHTAEVPAGRGYAVNYAVEFSFWDILFGTFYLPLKEGKAEQPVRLGHPGGLADERSYLKMLLMPLGLSGVVPAIKRVLGLSKGQQPAE